MIEVEKIHERLDRLRERIAKACAKASRDPDSVQLIGVTKTFPAEAVEVAREAGLRDFGENKVQELVAKAREIPGELEGGAVRWHMIGHLQRNKAKDVIAKADWFHALDSLRLAAELERRAAEAGRVLPCFVQVNVSNEDTKSGIQPGGAHRFLDELEAFEHLRIVGLMTLASPMDDPELVRPEFRQLRQLQETYRSSGSGRHDLMYLSMGMSGDFEVAIEEGATHIRVGSALFGARSYG